MTRERQRYAAEGAGHHRTLGGFKASRRGGWGMGLYRNTRSGKIAGVAAGVADYWEVAHWVVRLLWVAAFLFTGTLALWAYLAGWILLARRGDGAGVHGDQGNIAMSPGGSGAEMEYDEDRHDFRPRRPFRYSDSASERLRKAQERLDAATARVQRMEGYVTSRQYALNREFSRL